MKTLILSSSLAKNSRSFILCRKTAEALTNKGVVCSVIDARDIKIQPTHIEPKKQMEKLANKISQADNIIIGMGVHCYSINDSLKNLLENCFSGASGKFYGIVCAAGGEKSYLSTMHLTQICMNQWRMIQLPRIIYATSENFEGDNICSNEIIERIEIFAEEFHEIGHKLLS